MKHSQVVNHSDFVPRLARTILVDSSETASVGPVSSSLAAAVAAAVSVFGAAVTPKLSIPEGSPESKIRAPLEALLGAVASELGMTITPLDESELPDLSVRPDYAVRVNGAITGYVEVKQPGKGADPTAWNPKSHDAKQWEKLKALPNVLYTDGQEWALYRTGELRGELTRLTGDIRKAGAKLAPADDVLARTLADFLEWKPIAPRQIGQLVRSVAPLTRLLRDEVTDTLAREKVVGFGPFSDLAKDWRDLLFPEADDAQFADGYAQSVTFALLLARTEKIDFEGRSVDGIAKDLGKTHSLLGKALSILTDETIGVFVVTLDTLARVISVVDFSRFASYLADPYLALYEVFLEEYDPELRKRTGSYYTPTAVVASMTRLVDEVLRTRLGRDQGLAAEGVTIVDPAMGTGTYVLDVLQTVAATVEASEGPGAVASRLRDTTKRLVGIEIQTGPYAVAELRVAEALRRYKADISPGALRLYVADALDDPFAEETHLAATYAPIAASRRGANAVKAKEPVVVVLGNPPYRENAAGHGGFIEQGAPGTSWADPPIADFKEPGTGRYQKDLANLYVYFWRWAAWKVFDAVPPHPDGVICFITTSGYLKGPGFGGMRRYLRSHASEGWVIDCTPEGHQPDVSTRIFGGVQQPICIGLFVRRADNDPDVPAVVHYRALHGKRDAKFASLAALQLDADDWETCPTEWTTPFMPEGSATWEMSPLVGDLFPWHQSGLTPNRTWVYAPLASTLQKRWKVLIGAPRSEQGTLFKETNSSGFTRPKPGLAGYPHRPVAVSAETGPCLDPVPVAYRSFDVQFVVPDDRLMHRPRPELWQVRFDNQVYISEQHDQVIRSGPGLVFSAFTPDIHYYAARGGRVLPLYAGTDTSKPNVAPGFLTLLAEQLNIDVSPEDLLAYVAAVTAHPGFTTKFAEDLRTPGVRVPISAERAVWDEAVALGRRVLWLHSRGERYVDGSASRPKGPPDLSPGDPRRPMVVRAIPGTDARYPDELSYDGPTETLKIGLGEIAPVSKGVIDYEISGMNVVRKWFGYRRKTRPRTRGEQSPLDDVRPTTWPSAYTTDLLELLRVLTLVVELEPDQEALLDHVLGSACISVADLIAASVLPVPPDARQPLKRPKPPKGKTPHPSFPILT